MQICKEKSHPGVVCGCADTQAGDAWSILKVQEVCVAGAGAARERVVENEIRGIPVGKVKRVADYMSLEGHCPNFEFYSEW